MQDGTLERAFAQRVVQRCARLAKEQRELAPVLEQVTQRLAEAGIWLDLPLLELLVHPALELPHQRRAMGHVEREALLGRELVGATARIVLVDLGDDLDDVAARLGE